MSGGNTRARATAARGVIRIAMAMGLAACASAPATTPQATPGSTATEAPAPVSPAPAPFAPEAPPALFVPDSSLSLCPRLAVSNAPAFGADRSITGYLPFVRVNDSVNLAVAPTTTACLSSSFGIRSHKPHKGTDLQSDPASVVHAAASGEVMEAGWHDDYGNQVVLDHGSGVFTRYAHLATLESDIVEGARLPFGAVLGRMGATASYSIPVHLHYEVLIGDYDTQKKSFGLLPVNIFDYPYTPTP